MPHHTHARSPLRWLVAAFAAVAAVAVAATPALASAAPTAPPPVTVLTSAGHADRSDIFITPTGDTTQYANGPEILDRNGNAVWFHASRRARGRRLPRAALQRPAGPDLVAGHRPRRPGQRHRLHLRRPVPADRHRQRRQRASADGHEFLITPQNTALILAYTTATADLTSIGGPAEPDRHRRRRPGDRHPHRQGPVPVEQRRPRPLQPERAAAARLARARRGTGSTSTPSTSIPTAIC